MNRFNCSQPFVILMALMSIRTRVAYKAVIRHLFKVSAFPYLRVIMTDFVGLMRGEVVDVFGFQPMSCNVHYDMVIAHDIKSYSFVLSLISLYINMILFLRRLCTRGLTASVAASFKKVF